MTKFTKPSGDLSRTAQEISKAERDSLIPIFSADIEGSVYNRLISQEMKDAIDNLVYQHNYLLTWGPDALESRIKHSSECHRIRLNFWLEYEESVQNLTQIPMSKIIRGVCTPFWFKEHILSDPMSLMYILHPPGDYTAFMHESLDLMMRDSRKILREPYKKKVMKRRKDADGNWEDVEEEVIDHKLIDQKMKIWERAENRIKGIAPQRLQIEQTSKNYNYNKNEQIESKPRSLSVEALDAEIAKLDAPESVLSIEAKNEDD